MTDHITRPTLMQRYEQVAATPEAQIRSEAPTPGDRLPSKRARAQWMEINNATLCEALAAPRVAALVAAHQSAGFYVVDALPGERKLALPHDASASALPEEREIFEPAIASLAADGGFTDPEIERRLEVMAESEDPTDPEQRQQWSDADREFHLPCAYATGNTGLIAIAEHVAETMDQLLWRWLCGSALAMPDRTSLSLAEHRLIAAAIAEGDAAGAAPHVTEHIKRTRRDMALTN